MLPKRAGAKKAYEKEMARKAAKAATKASDERQANPNLTLTLTLYLYALNLRLSACRFV